MGDAKPNHQGRRQTDTPRATQTKPNQDRHKNRRGLTREPRPPRATQEPRLTRETQEQDTRTQTNRELRQDRRRWGEDQDSQGWGTKTRLHKTKPPKVTPN